MRRPLIVLVGLVLAALTVLAAPAPAGAASRPAAGVSAGVALVRSPGQEPDAPADDGTGGSADDTVDEPQPGAPEQDIIPRPNSGHEPTDAGDRGGALQILVFVAILAGVGTIGGLAARDVRRSRARAQAGVAAGVAPGAGDDRPGRTGAQPSGPNSSQAS